MLEQRIIDLGPAGPLCGFNDMAHFAKLDVNNKVISVLVVDNEDIKEGDQEIEEKGIQFLKDLTGHEKWVQTSYNRKFRKHYAMIGGSYLPEHDAFVPPKPFASWVLNTEKYLWVPPTSYPQDGGEYEWDENTVSWSLIPPQTQKEIQ